jgi:cullin 1
VTLDVYENEFETDFLKDTSEYYQRKSQKWTEEDSFPDYLRKVHPLASKSAMLHTKLCYIQAEDLYAKEKHRCATYLHPSTEPKLLKASIHIRSSPTASHPILSGCSSSTTN